MKHDDSLPEHLASLLDDNELCIFLFHGVVLRSKRNVRNYTGKHLNRELFVRSIEAISQAGQALSMNEVIWHCENKVPFPPKSFAVTFDDGFENNVSVAAPVLVDLKVPATIYVTTDFVDRNRMSWIDRVESAVEIAPDQVFCASWTKENFSLGDVTSRIYFLEAVRRLVKTSSSVNPDDFAGSICLQLGVEGSDYPDSELDCKMSWEQVREVARSEMFTIGGHSHSHPILSFLSAQDLDYELDTCFALLKEQADIEPSHFSYPEGLQHCYSGEVIDALRERGVRSSPTAIAGRNTSDHDLFHLRRFLVA